MGGEEERASPGDAAAQVPRARSPWLPALAVVGALALAHLGLGLVLTRSARAATRDIEAAWTAEELAAARPPGVQPETRGEEWTRWQRAERIWADAETLRDRRSQVAAFTWSLAASFALQAGFVLWLALRARGSRG